MDMKLVRLVVPMLLATLAQAGEFKLGKAYIVGGICPKTDVLVAPTPEGLELDIERFGLALGPGTQSGLPRVTCNVRIPITLPPGWRVRRIEGQVDGNIAKSRNAEMSLTIMASLGTLSANETFSFQKVSLYGSEDYQERFSAFPRFNFGGAVCKRQDLIGLDAKWTGSRPSRNDFAISTGNGDDERDGLRSHYKII